MEQKNNIKNSLTASVFEFACKKDFKTVIKKILTDEELSSNLSTIFTDKNSNEERRVKPVYIFIQILRQLLSSVETFSNVAVVDCYPWSSDALSKIIKMFEKTYEQCDFISIKKFFSLLSELKLLDLMHLLKFNVESSALMQKLNMHFPRWHSSYKETLQKQFSIENPKIFDKVEESCSQCRRLILKLAADSTYRSLYMRNQFSDDMKKMMMGSVAHLKEVIANLSSKAGLTAIERSLSDQPMCSDADDLENQLLLDYLQPEATSETLLQFLNEMEHALEPPSGGFSSCLLPFDTLSECSDAAMDSEDENDGSGSESSSEDSDEKDKTITDDMEILMMSV